MTGIWSQHAQTYLLTLACITTLTFALPITLMPLTWARWFRWQLPAHTDLAVYFGRCTGVFVLIVEVLLVRAGLTGEGLAYTFQVLMMVAAAMVVLHLVGAIQRIQPFTETLEIGLYAGMFALTVLFYPVAA